MGRKDKNKNEKKTKTTKQMYLTILLVMVAVASATAVTVAWLSIADNTKVKSMDMDVTSGEALRFDLDKHNSFDEYVSTLTFSGIAARIQQVMGFSVEKTPLQPVTTSDFTKFTFENGSTVDAKSGAFLEFDLNFMATKDMTVHLSTHKLANRSTTAVTSSNSSVPRTMRISFTADGTTYIYNPGMSNQMVANNGGRMFGLPSDMVYNTNNAMFSLKAHENKVVKVHVWLEGTDQYCTDDVKGADYSISLLFEGTDSNNQPFE